jgi:hypothetical protein
MLNRKFAFRQRVEKEISSASIIIFLCFALLSGQSARETAAAGPKGRGANRWISICGESIRDASRQWKACPNSLEVSGYHQNMRGGFSSLKIGVLAKGKGNVMIDD